MRKPRQTLFPTCQHFHQALYPLNVSSPPLLLLLLLLVSPLSLPSALSLLFILNIQPFLHIYGNLSAAQPVGLWTVD